MNVIPTDDNCTQSVSSEILDLNETLNNTDNAAQNCSDTQIEIESQNTGDDSEEMLSADSKTETSIELSLNDNIELSVHSDSSQSSTNFNEKTKLKRVHKPPTYLRDFICNNDITDSD
ncbi:hypothetical protein JTB14_005852 [Gonioctena quinquepunctata]|nr:hypothetical protein JTB14_005852 [Gonioctena quinquepunctata]